MTILQELEKKENPLNTNYEKVWYPRKRVIKVISSAREELQQEFCKSASLCKNWKCKACQKINEVLGDAK